MAPRRKGRGLFFARPVAGQTLWFRRRFSAEKIPGGATRKDGDQLAAAHEAAAKVIEVDDFPPEALSSIYKKPAEVHQFFQELGETRAAS